MKLFRSHNPDFEDGMQMRDFIYVKDIVSIISFCMNIVPKTARTMQEQAKPVHFCILWKLFLQH